MELSVIILNYKVRYFLELCLLSVKEAIKDIDAEIIVVDNNSDDSSCEVIRTQYPEVIVIENKENVGFAKGNNQGVAIAKGEYVCILNPDTVVPGTIFNSLIKNLNYLPNPGIIAPRLIDGTGNFLQESKRNIPSPLTSFRRLFGIKLGKVRSYYADHIPDHAIGDVDILVGAFMLMKREVYLEVGGFDEDYFMYGEDIDLSYKIKKSGRGNYYDGKDVVIHFKGESTDRNADYVRRFYGAMRIFYKKHFKSNWLLDSIVSLGIRLVSIAQLFKNHEKIKEDVQEYILISDNEALRNQLETELKRKVELLSKESLKLHFPNKKLAKEVIFDNDCISYDHIIETIYSLRKDNFTFKIRPSGCNFILGSDFSDGKGEVITF
ncbi:MAG: glycosyl transferase family 2 [Aquimarina sp.]|nr:glycosyl transferase family 2 [Aquimarina sp.]